MSKVELNYRRIVDELPEVTVLPVTKYVGVEEMKKLLDAGAKLIGENRVQDAAVKFVELERLGYRRESFQRHLIGHLQTNKVKKAVEFFDVIQSVDSLKVAKLISRVAVETGKEIEIYLQVNAADDEAKYGLKVGEVEEVAKAIVTLPSLRFGGLMMIGRLGAERDDTKRDFERMKKLFDKVKNEGLFEVDDPQLSMGMSDDYQLAVQCGATMVRLGSVLYK